VDGRYLALGSVKGDIAVVSATDLSKLMFLTVHDICVTDIALFVDKSHPQKVAILSCSFDRTLISTPFKPNVTSPRQLLFLVTIFILILAILYQLFM